jgi:hypothetical protein
MSGAAEKMSIPRSICLAFEADLCNLDARDWQSILEDGINLAPSQDSLYGIIVQID